MTQHTAGGSAAAAGPPVAAGKGSPPQSGDPFPAQQSVKAVSSPPNPFRVAAAADLPNPFHAAAAAAAAGSCRRASAPVQSQILSNFPDAGFRAGAPFRQPLGSATPSQQLSELTAIASLALSDTGRLSDAAPPPPPSAQQQAAVALGNGDSLLAKLQARLSAVQVARSREGSQLGSPSLRDEMQQQQQRQQQPPPHEQHDSTLQQALADAPPATLPADLAAAIRAAAATRAQDQLFGALPQLRADAAAAGDGAAEAGAAAEPAEGEATTTSEEGDDKTVFLQPPPVQRQGSCLRVHSGSFCLPASTLRRVTPPDLSHVLAAARGDSLGAPSRVESGRMDDLSAASGRLPGGRGDAGPLSPGRAASGGRIEPPPLGLSRVESGRPGIGVMRGPEQAQAAGPDRRMPSPTAAQACSAVRGPAVCDVTVESGDDVSEEGWTFHWTMPLKEGWRTSSKQRSAPMQLAAAAEAAAAVVAEHRRQLAAGLIGAAGRHATPTPDEREATAGLAQLVRLVPVMPRLRDSAA